MLPLQKRNHGEEEEQTDGLQPCRESEDQQREHNRRGRKMRPGAQRRGSQGEKKTGGGGTEKRGQQERVGGKS